MPNEISHTSAAATEEEPREEPQPYIFTPQSTKLQSEPDYTSVGADEEIRVEPTTEALREDVTADQQEGEAHAVEDTVRGPQLEPEKFVPNHATSPTITTNNEDRPEPNILDIFYEE